jgi:hypothetical protein
MMRANPGGNGKTLQDPKTSGEKKMKNEKVIRPRLQRSLPAGNFTLQCNGQVNVVMAVSYVGGRRMSSGPVVEAFKGKLLPLIT